MRSKTRRAAALALYAWVLWAQTRTSAPHQPVKDEWEIVDTFGTQEECEHARVTLAPLTGKAEAAWPLRPRYVCFPDTLDPKATP